MDRLLIYRALMFGICGYAIFRGKTDARLIALAFLIGDLATLALRTRYAGSYQSVEINVMILDVMAFLAFTYAALISERFWPLWISGLQLTASFGHAFKAIDENLLPLAYAAALRFWSWPILIILAVGTWRSHRRSAQERRTAAA